MTTLLKSRPRQIEGSSYASLRKRVRETLLEGQQKIEHQKVLTYWQTGKYIKEHLLLSKDRADLGQRVIQRLAEDLEIGETNLWKMLQFARAFPVLDARLELPWAHYRAAMRVPDETKRLSLIEKASKEGWTSRELEVEVRNHNWFEHVLQSEGKKSVQLPPVHLGPFHTYKIIRPETIRRKKRELLLDCGFSFKKELSAVLAAGGTHMTKHKWAEAMIVTSVKNARGFSLEAVKHAASKNENDLLHTYRAYVVDIIDGDTLKLDFRLGFGDRKGETIRLNAIDCPEMNTPEGRSAKRFVEAQLSGCEFVIVKSIQTRKEKWGRYLGDVFFDKKANGSRIYKPVGNEKISPGSTQAARLEYLNQLLLDKGHAVRSLRSLLGKSIRSEKQV